MNSEASMTVATFLTPAAGGPGRHLTVSPDNSPLRLLRYSRLMGTPTSGRIQFNTGDCETALLGLDGLAFVLVADEVYELGPCDTLYIPRASDIEVHADSPGYDLAEVAVPCTTDNPVQFTSYAEVAADPRLHCGDRMVLIGPNVRTERLHAGLSFSYPVDWGELLDDHAERICVFLEGFSPTGCLLVPAGVSLPALAPSSPVRCIWMTAVSHGLEPKK